MAWIVQLLAGIGHIIKGIVGGAAMIKESLRRRKRKKDIDNVEKETEDIKKEVKDAKQDEKNIDNLNSRWGWPNDKL